MSTPISTPFFISQSPAMQRVLHQLQEVAQTPLTVLLLGETGTGKGVAAHALHQWSSRPHQPFVHLDCSSLPPSLLDSELFGHEKGAFTGASLQRKGRIEQAQGGTLFLDEIGELPLEAQARLLRLLQDRLIERVGGTQPLHLDVRVIAATHRDLEQAVKKGAFRQDLFYRLHVFPIHLPALRERQEDIPLLAEYERRYLVRVLEHTAGVIHGQRGAARLLGIKPTTLRSRLEKLGLRHTRNDRQPLARRSA